MGLLTYDQLLVALQELGKEQLDMEMVVLDGDGEIFPIFELPENIPAVLTEM